MVDAFDPVSEKPLIKTVIATSKEFIPTDIEWNMRNRTQLVLNTSAAGIFYTVPSNITFWLTGFNLTIRDAAGSSNVSLNILAPDDSTRGKLTHIWLTGPDKAIISQDLKMPIKIPENHKLHISGSPDNLECSVFGWEEPKKITPT